MGRRWLWLGVVALALVGADARAATLAPIGSFTDPVFVTSEPNNSDHLLVVEQAGRIELSNGGVVTPYLEIEDLVAVGYEEGLLSVATAPDYASSGLIYVFYTNNAGDLQIDEFRASAGSVSPATRRPVLTIPHPAEDNHNGGQLQFGPDGLLYIGTGDGGGVGDPAGNAQNLDSLLGKILRIDPRASGYRPYTVPASNPLVGIGGRGEIWSWGLRNPWRFSFDRLTGDLTIADVGQNEWEEVNFAPAPASGRGANFGWDPCEGLHAYPPTTPASPCPGGSLTAPVLEYPHTGAACSITGGYVVRDPSVADLYGRYVYADACSAQVSSAQLALPAATGVRTEPFGPAQPSSFGEDACARVYLASLGADAVYRLTGDTAPTCPPPTPGPGDPSPARSRCGGKAVTRVSLDGGRFEGTRRADVIVAGPKRDRIAGRGGNDVICGLSGRDVLKGGDGKDFLLGGRGDDSCAGGPRRDRTRSC